MAEGKARRIDRAFKVAALARMAAGASVSALSQELGVRRKLLYQRREMVQRGGVAWGRAATGQGAVGCGGRAATAGGAARRGRAR